MNYSFSTTYLINNRDNASANAHLRFKTAYDNSKKDCSCIEINRDLYSNKNYRIAYHDNANIDIWLIEAIMIPIEYDLSMLEYFEISIGGQIIWNIPFDLLTKLTNIKKGKFYYLIPIPIDIYGFYHEDIYKLYYIEPEFKYYETNLNGISKFLLGYHDIGFCLKSKSECEIIYSIIQKITSLCESSKNRIIDINKSKMLMSRINQYTEIQFTNTKIINNISMYDDIKESSGIFIKTNKKLKYIKFNWMDKILLCYDNDMIKHVGKVIHKNYRWTMDHTKAFTKAMRYILPQDIINIIIDYVINIIDLCAEYWYWIPFEPHEEWNTKNPHCVNFRYSPTMYDDGWRKKTIEFNENLSGCIYFLNYNALVYSNGMGATYTKAAYGLK